MVLDIPHNSKSLPPTAFNAIHGLIGFSLFDFDTRPQSLWWSFGFNTTMPGSVINLSDGSRQSLFYVSANTGFGSCRAALGVPCCVIQLGNHHHHHRAERVFAPTCLSNLRQRCASRRHTEHACPTFLWAAVTQTRRTGRRYYFSFHFLRVQGNALPATTNEACQLCCATTLQCTLFKVRHQNLGMS